jgi:AcrR family transcriptional regulator
VLPAQRNLTPQGEDRKAELLRHAEALFMERGYAETRMIDIARAAGVAKGLFYWYFENKRALFHEIVLDMRQRLRRAQSAAMEGVDDPLARVYVGTVASVRFIAEHHRLYGPVAAEVSADRRIRRARSQSIRVHADDAAALFAEGQRRGVVRTDDDAVTLAHANAAIVNHFVLLYSNGLFACDLDDLAHRAARYALYAVAGDEAAATCVLTAYGDPRAARPVLRRRHRAP